ncbi:hypothetical protein DXD59_00715 [Olsenella sp. TM06-36]|jgi:hypothetical protein|uniref:primase alpha helix C-terminal domain-containing protein n=1 Tax=unclassified Olsenella TaxID=2638792 RepID=UPI000E433EF5|nr:MULTISPECIES: primase alpha helix C-terminal domain-containing protein [unclassified Olsenella]RGJ47452.1 hypothetical protein DXD59_00715 [Olsenella sp. TM06-36]RHJ96149.1 hypothetical protein DW092_00710 [Olsenella sp. AM05-7]RHK00417.1 hypothetical protein DW090_01410 [Olsenella sp. AM05-17]
MPFLDFSTVGEGELDMPDAPTAREGGRNAALFSYLASARARGAGNEDVYELARKANEGFFPPLPDKEVWRTAHSVVTSYERGMSRTRPTVLDTVREAASGAVPKVDGSADLAGMGDPTIVGRLAEAVAQLRSMFSEDDTCCIVWNPRRGFSYSDGTFDGGEAHWIVGWLTQDAAGLDMLRSIVSASLDGGVYLVTNPLGEGTRRRDADVSTFRNLLVESDEIPKERQVERLWALFGPDAPRGFRNRLRCVVDSGNKSMHGMVSCRCNDIAEYKAAAAMVYRYCAKNGLIPDAHCANPARLSRLAGCMRGDREQRLVWCDA